MGPREGRPLRAGMISVGIKAGFSSSLQLKDLRFSFGSVVDYKVNFGNLSLQTSVALK